MKKEGKWQNYCKLVLQIVLDIYILIKQTAIVGGLIGKAREKNVGWRIDYFITSKDIENKIKQAVIYSEIYGSDHCPVGLEIEI